MLKISIVCKNLTRTRMPQNLSTLKVGKRFVSTQNNGSNTQSETVDSSEPVKLSEAEINANLQQEIKELKEKVLRSLAEEENVRRIAKRDVENARNYANASFAKAMLEVADNLDRALTVVPADERLSTDNPTLSGLVKGIEMTDKNLHKILNQFGIHQYGKIDEHFDPNLHDALFQIPNADKPAGTIGQVVKVGYKMKDRVIRAAQVGTITKPSE